MIYMEENAPDRDIYRGVIPFLEMACALCIWIKICV